MDFFNRTRVCLDVHSLSMRQEEEVVLPQKKLSTKDLVDVERSSKEKTTAMASFPRSPPKSPPNNFQSTGQLKSEIKSSAALDPLQVKKATSNCPQQADKTTSITIPQNKGMPKPETQNASTPKLPEKPVLQQVPVMSRPSSAPVMPVPRPTAPVVSMVQTTPLLARSVSATGRLAPEPSPATHSFVPQSYRNAIMGNSVGSSSSGFTHSNSSSSGVNLAPVHMQPPTLVSASMYLSPSSDRVDPNSVQSGFPFGMATRDVLQNGPQWMENSQRDASRSMHGASSSLINGIQNMDLYEPVHSGSQEHFSAEFPAFISLRQTQGGVTDEFPHLDIINDLLNDEHVSGKGAGPSRAFQSLSNGPHLLNRQFSFPCDVGGSTDLGSSTSSSCRFDRMRSYHDGGFQRSYSSTGTHFDGLREFIPQPSPLPYANGQIDGLVPNQWQMAGSDLSLAGIRNTEVDGSPYFSPDYSNLACGVNGYTVFRPSNGH